MADERSEPSLDTTLAKAAQGDAEAWRVLVNAYSKRVYALIVRQCGDRELAEEVTQATFAKLVRKIEGYRERGRFEPWLFRIAMNHLRDEMRRRKRQARPMDMSGAGSGGDSERESAWAAVESQVVDRSAGGVGLGLAGEGGDGEQPVERVSRAEQVDLLRRAVLQLSPADQEVINLRHTAGLSFGEIAKTLGEPLGTILARGHRALAKLRKIMEESQ